MPHELKKAIEAVLKVWDEKAPSSAYVMLVPIERLREVYNAVKEKL